MPVSADTAFPHRLAVRQALPILTGLLCLLSLPLLLGYLQARDTVLDAAGGRARQLSGAASTVGAQFLQRSQKRLEGIARRLEEAGPHGATAMLRPGPSSLAELVAAGFAAEPGWKTITIRAGDEHGTLRSAVWTRKNTGGSPEASFTGSDGRDTALPGNGGKSPLADPTPRWRGDASPMSGPDAPLRLDIPLSGAGEELSRTFGSVSLLVDTAWLLAFAENAAGPEGMRAVILPAPEARPGAAAGTRAERTAVFTPLVPEEACLGVLVTEKTLFGQVHALAWTFFLLTLAAVLPAAWSLHATTRGMLRPLEYLTDMAARLSRGDFEASGKVTGGAVSGDALSVLSRGRGLTGARAGADEPARLVRAADALRSALKQRAQDLTLVATARERILGELALARAIQEGIRPRHMPRAANVDAAAHLHVTRAVCGDMYDVFFRSAHSLCCVLGDVASRGVPASLLMGRVMPLLRELLLSGMPPSTALETVNKTLCAGEKNAAVDFIGAIAGVLDIRNGHFTWAGAGQPPPLRFNAASVLELPWSENMPLGIRREARYRTLAMRLQNEEGLFFASDGLHSAQSRNGGLYGEKRLAEALRRFASESPKRDCQSLLQAMHEDVLAYAAPEGSQDDIAMLAVRWKSPCE